MSKYAEYDQALLNLIRGGNCRFLDLMLAMRDRNESIQESDSWRVTDRRLQALRKADKIYYSKSDQVWRTRKSA